MDTFHTESRISTKRSSRKKKKSSRSPSRRTPRLRDSSRVAFLEEQVTALEQARDSLQHALEAAAHNSKEELARLSKFQELVT